MNKKFALGFESLLLVGALLPFSPLMPTEATQVQRLTDLHHDAPSLTAPATDRVAFGRGAPRFRSGGGTR